MPQQLYKRIGEKPAVRSASKLDIMRDVWTDMKPFVKFSVKAMKVIAHALIFIVKHIPKPEDDKPASKNNKVIKIS